MIKRLDDLEIDENEPFKNDVLNRKDCAENLTTLIQSSQSPLVLAVNAPWGMGKTTFIKMWQQHLKNEGHLTLYFNTWENDHCEKPIVSFISEIESIISESEISQHEKDKLSANYKNVKSAGKSFLKYAIPTLVRLASQGLINFDKETDKALDNFAEKLAENQIKEYQEKKESISSFKKSLQAFAKEVFSREEFSKQPIIIFVDELDRCRPSFAIELLENIKHIFSVPGFVFVLGIDNEQLAHSVKSVYGNGMDSDGYLRRFFDLDYSLPNPNREEFKSFLYRKFYFDSLFMGRTDRSGTYDQLLNTVWGFSEEFNLSLRTMITCFSQINIILTTTDKNHLLYPCYLAFLVVLKLSKPSLFKRLISEFFTHKSFLSFLNEVDIKGEFKKSYEWRAIRTYLYFSILNSYEQKLVVEYFNEKWNSKLNEDEKNDIGNLMADIDDYGKGPINRLSNIQKHLIKKLGFSERFKLE